ncbi:MAG: hypothetical protein Q7S02_06545 [bacterium]|nr:hypothetical protein [bacterium]
MKYITAKRLAALLDDEMERDSWGDLNTFLFKMIGEGNLDEEDEHFEDAKALEEVLVRVVKRLRMED